MSHHVARQDTAVITAATRLPIGRKGGTLAHLDGAELGALAIRALIAQESMDPTGISDVIMGNTLSHYGNSARVAVLAAELPPMIPAVTIDRQCGSGINSVLLASALARTDGGTYIAGGMESMTNEPFQLSRPRRAYATQPPKFLRRELSTPEIGDPTMGITAENLAQRYDISREEQDEFAAGSQAKYAEALALKKYDQFVVPVSSNSGDSIQQDEHPRPGTTIEKLAALSPAFKEGGTVTAGNASGINDGAAVVTVMAKTKSYELGLKPLAVIGQYAVVGVDPNFMGIGPVPAIQTVLRRAGTTLEDYTFIEINEAFAVQVLACLRELNLPTHRVNPLGGAIAHGHPIAATGTILIQKAITELYSRGGGRALVSACIGGGQGIAVEVIVEGE